MTSSTSKKPIPNNFFYSNEILKQKKKYNPSLVIKKENPLRSLNDMMS